MDPWIYNYITVVFVIIVTNISHGSLTHLPAPFPDVVRHMASGMHNASTSHGAHVTSAFQM
jgi:hypothetical protein